MILCQTTNRTSGDDTERFYLDSRKILEFFEKINYEYYLNSLEKFSAKSREFAYFLEQITRSDEDDQMIEINVPEVFELNCNCYVKNKELVIIIKIDRETYKRSGFDLVEQELIILKYLKENGYIKYFEVFVNKVNKVVLEEEVHQKILVK